jgi:hypothetical protein
VKKIPPRIHVLLARKAKVGVVIRRGPSKTVCTLLWDRRRDKFTLGQWMRGRIYERRCDLSPDGKHLIYFAMNGRWNSPAGGSWTAISRAPYLKAIALYPKGDCWFGGGLFLGNHTFWLNQGPYGYNNAIDVGKLRTDPWFRPKPSYGGECPGVYYHRLVRDGWTYVEHVEENERSSHDVFEKELTSGWTLRKIAHASIDHPVGTGCYWDKYELRHGETNERQVFGDWEWADYESRRVVWAAGGRIFAGRIKREGLGDIKELYDFGNMTFEAIKAPY